MGAEETTLEIDLWTVDIHRLCVCRKRVGGNVDAHTVYSQRLVKL